MEEDSTVSLRRAYRLLANEMVTAQKGARYLDAVGIARRIISDFTGEEIESDLAKKILSFARNWPRDETHRIFLDYLDRYGVDGASAHRIVQSLLTDDGLQAAGHFFASRYPEDADAPPDERLLRIEQMFASSLYDRIMGRVAASNS